MSRASTPNPFLYIASKPSGKRAIGLRRARNRASLSASLRRERLVLRRSVSLPAWVGNDAGMTTRDHANLNDQLAQLVSRGVPLVEALGVAADVVSENARPIIMKLMDQVQGGKAFAEACRGTGQFDVVTVAVYAAAERTGDLSGACKQLATNARRQLAVKGKAATLMIYPAIVFAISVIVATLMLTFIVPQIGESLQKAGNDLPWITEAMMVTGNWIKSHALLVAGGVAALLILAILGRGSIIVASQKLMRRLPAMRDVVLAQELARFFSVMAAMTRSGVTLADALGVAVTALGHPAMKKDLGRLRSRLIEGGVLRSLIDRVETLPLGTRKLLIAADQAGDLEHAFDSLANDYTDEVETKTDRLLALLEPLLIVFMFLVIGSLILAIMVPMIQATSRGI
ncbi:MAG: type II secretory pathway component PulF [Phycisphaerales bacterium]|jgi:type II secretory pathway component PulF